MEVCVDSVSSAINAADGGAVRLELCSNLVEGGTTPSIGRFGSPSGRLFDSNLDAAFPVIFKEFMANKSMLQVVKERVSVPVFVMIRPRGGDFMYTEEEINVMVQDILALKQAGADGFVFGILNINGTVDTVRCKVLKEYASQLPVTFHRAIDMTADIPTALEAVINLGFERVLTSGGDSTALEGLPTICKMVKQAKGRVTVMPDMSRMAISDEESHLVTGLVIGGGINERNIERILSESCATEFHCSARVALSSQMSFRKEGISMGATYGPLEYSVKVTDKDKVQKLISMAATVWDNGT